jgi:integrase
VEGYKHVIDTHICPALGDISLKSFKPEQIQKYYAFKLSSGLSTTSVRHHHMVLHKAFEHAVKWGLLIRNICDAVSPPTNRHTEMKILQAEDIDLVFKAAKKAGYYHLIFTALMTGMRRSELTQMVRC